MSNKERWAGCFVWRELRSAQPERSAAFVSELFGWSFDADRSDGGGRIMCGDRHLATVTRIEAGTQGEPGWLPHIGVTALTEALGKVHRLGGRTISDPESISNIGQRAEISDPLGARIALLEPSSAVGLQADGRRRFDLGWSELACGDPSQGLAFYTGLFGWTSEHTPMGSLELHMFMRQEQRLASAVGDVSLGGGTARWIDYVMVPDVHACCEQAQGAGGAVSRAPVEVPGLGSFAAVEDPSGARLALWQDASL